MPREAVLVRTMVELTDTLVDDFDIVELLTTLSDRCVEVLDIAASGIMLADPSGDLRVMTSSSEEMRLVELFELQNQEGPCLDAFRSGRPVVNDDLATATDRWPRFAAVATAAGYRGADSIPMRLRRQTIGALNLFRTEPGSLGHDDVTIAQALADVATIAIIQHRAVLETTKLTDQLQGALDSRIVIEQAKGMIAERERLDMTHAFDRLRRHARNHHLRLAELASAVVSGTVDSSTLDTPSTASTETPTGRRAG